MYLLARFLTQMTLPPPSHTRTPCPTHSLAPPPLPPGALWQELGGLYESVDTARRPPFLSPFLSLAPPL